MRDAMPAVRLMHEFALASPAWIHRNLAPADMPQWLKQREEDARKGMDPRDYAAQLRAMLGHDVTRRFGGSLEKAGAAVRARVLVIAPPSRITWSIRCPRSKWPPPQASMCCG